MEFNIPKPILGVLDTLEKNGFQAWLVGGCVRDMLLGKEPKDYDVTTNARPEQIEALFDHSFALGKKHGTITVLAEDEKGKEWPVEITTFRKDGEYLDHRRPKEVAFVDDIDQDLKRRDFTINAMAYHPERGLYDPYEGQKDLERKLIRAVGNPKDRFEEDALRMLRAYRFAGRLNFELEEETEAAIKECEHLLAEISKERIRDEITQILQGSPLILDQMTSLLKDVLPELQIMLDCEQNNVHHYTDVLHHTLDALNYLKDNGYSDKRAWALLLHDTGKPASKTHDERGDHFTDHPRISKKIAQDVLKRFKFSKEFQQDVPLLVLLHDAFYKPSLKNLYKLQVQYGMDDDLVEDLFAVQKGDIDAHTKHDRLEGLQKFIDFYHEEKDAHPKDLRDLPINGQDVLDLTELKGADIQKMLARLQKEAFLNPQLNDRARLLERMKQLEHHLDEPERRPRKRR